MTQGDKSPEVKASVPEPEMVPLTVDGKRYMGQKGQNLLDFMLSRGIEISSFCWHPGLSVVAVCRQCLVEVKGSPKLVPACQTPIQAGMEVTGSSDRVLEARRQMLEFTLQNHPVDCPICDKAGECTLQRHYMDWGAGGSRLNHPKVHKPKRVAVGPRIVLDDERCILCTRCVRFCAEVAKRPQLVIARRGHHSVLTTAPGEPLDNPYSVCTVDICPVGALTDSDFRFKRRVWDLSATMSVCVGCASGCPCEVHHEGGRVYRVVPRKVGDINLNWMCDFGRLTYHAVHERRVPRALLAGSPVALGAALEHAAGKLRALRESAPGSVGFVLGADTTNEDLFVAARLALDFVGTERLYLAEGRDTGLGDGFLRESDPNPNRAGAAMCGRGKLAGSLDLARDLAEGKLRALYVASDVADFPGESLDRAAGLELLAVQAVHESPLAAKAHVVLPAASWAEVDGTVTSVNRRVQRLRAAVPSPGSAAPHHRLLLELARRMGLTLEYPSARSIFEAARRSLDGLREAEFGSEIPPRLLRFAGSRG
jgi:NADH-quinone oxidoreductase subunit G